MRYTWVEAEPSKSMAVGAESNSCGIITHVVIATGLAGSQFAANLEKICPAFV